jgi:hypothetical protein
MTFQQLCPGRKEPFIVGNLNDSLAFGRLWTLFLFVKELLDGALLNILGLTM